MSVVLVTGAGGGVGSAVAARFTTGGWDVIGTDRSGVRASTDAWVAADLLDVAQIRDMVEQAVAQHGRLDCVVHAAGLWEEDSAVRRDCSLPIQYVIEDAAAAVVGMSGFGDLCELERVSQQDQIASAGGGGQGVSKTELSCFVDE